MRRLSIGICCFPGLGGSGIVGTELGIALARLGHRVHFVCAARPRRLPAPTETMDNLWFHPVSALTAPARSGSETPDALALAVSLAEVAHRERLDVLHAHYAIPHASSAVMAREMLGSALRVVTTLHGTDVSALGAVPGDQRLVRHAVMHSDRVTTPSAFLRELAYARLSLDEAAVPINVIPNFVDTARFRPPDDATRPQLTARFGPALADRPVLVHVSNFRPIKRVDWVVEIFRRAVARRPLSLLLIGDGPVRAATQREIARLGLSDAVRFTGDLTDAAALVRECAVLLLPSVSESFGLAALEALASGVPVVASRTGGLPEVLRHGETGFLEDSIPAMVSSVLTALDRRPQLSLAARQDALTRFQTEQLVSRYEALYADLLADDL